MGRKKGPQINQAFEYIRDKIISYELLPGEVVSTSNLSEELDMSRTPIREAILLLNSVGLIEIKDGKMCVSPLGLADIIEICQVREAVACTSVNIIMENGGLQADQRQKLTKIFVKLSETLSSFNFKENYFYDDLFHTTLVKYCANKRLMNISDMMRLQIQRARWLNVVLPDNRRKAAHDEHKNILDAILDNNQEACIKAIKDHLSKSKEHFTKIINDPNLRLAMISIQSIYKDKPAQ